MSDRPVYLPGPDGSQKLGYEVRVEESTDRWCDLKLSDGTTLRVKPMIAKVFRLDNEFDQEGNPIYVLHGGQIVTIGSVPQTLKKGES